MRVATVLLVASLALAPTALASDRFSDPRGDADGGPDITAVTLANTDDVLRISVEFASSPPLGYDEAEGYTDMLLIGIHTDDDQSQADVEYWTGVHGVDPTRAMVVRAGRRAIVGYADVAVDGTTVSLEVRRALLEDPDEVAVQVAAGREYADETAGAAGGGGDFAPASGAHLYALAGGDGPAWLRPLVATALAALALAAVTALIVRRPRPGSRDAGRAAST